MRNVAEYTEVYAVPGQDHVIDMIDPDTGLTAVYGKTEADVLASDPRAVRMTWEAWRTEAAARQHTRIVWQRSTKAQYWEMLEILPPALWIGGAFLVGEPYDHDFTTGAPRFTAYRQIGEDGRDAQYFVASRPLTRAELRAEVRR